MSCGWDDGPRARVGAYLGVSTSQSKAELSNENDHRYDAQQDGREIDAPRFAVIGRFVHGIRDEHRIKALSQR